MSARKVRALSGESSEHLVDDLTTLIEVTRASMDSSPIAYCMSQETDEYYEHGLGGEGMTLALLLVARAAAKTLSTYKPVGMHDSNPMGRSLLALAELMDCKEERRRKRYAKEQEREQKIGVTLDDLPEPGEHGNACDPGTPGDPDEILCWWCNQPRYVHGTDGRMPPDACEWDGQTMHFLAVDKATPEMIKARENHESDWVVTTTRKGG